MAKKPTKRKRPKSVMEKAWATRRAKQASDAKLTKTLEAIQFGEHQETEKALKAALRKAERSGKELKTPRSEKPIAFAESHVNAPSKLEIQTESILAAAKSNNRADARPGVFRELAAMLNEERWKAFDEASREHQENTDRALLCAFVAQFSLVDRPHYVGEFSPHIVSPITLRAIVRHLEAQGYTAKGKIGANQLGIRDTANTR